MTSPAAGPGRGAGHTPGPWHTRRAVKPDNVGGYDCAILNGEWHIVAEAFEVVDHTTKLPVEANAHLIAAAPDLLASCEEIWDLIEQKVLVRNIEDDGEPGWLMKQMPLVLAISKLQTAIDKAHGTPAASPAQPGRDGE